MNTTDWSIVRSITSIHLTDFFDIAIASLLIYGVLRMLRTLSNPMPLVGAVLVLGVYFIARVSGLFLTEMLLRSAALTLSVVFAIAFQEDIRRVVLRWRHWRPHRPIGQSRLRNTDVDPLVDLAFRCAEQRIGALIVFQGHEMLDSHLNGGIELLAPIKTVLMQSIFDPHSPGHDGAVVIRDGRIVRMCAHLPLSQNLGELKYQGTRHSAGLGLTEHTDAFVLIVSEERGIVSIAYDGKLTEVSSPAELKRQMEHFLEATSPRTKPKLGTRLFRHSVLKLLSVATALLGWFFFARHGETLEQTFVVPIEYRNIPPNLCLDDQPPAEASFTLSGPEPAFALIAPGSLRVRIDLEGYQAGAVVVRVSEQDCVHPDELSVYRIEPRVLRFQLVPCPPASGKQDSTHLFEGPRLQRAGRTDDGGSLVSGCRAEGRTARESAPRPSMVMRAPGVPGVSRWARAGSVNQKTWLSPNQIKGPRPVPTPTGWAMSTRRLARSRNAKRIVSTRMPTPTPWTTGFHSPRMYDWPTS